MTAACQRLVVSIFETGQLRIKDRRAKDGLDITEALLVFRRDECNGITEGPCWGLGGVRPHYFCHTPCPFALRSSAKRFSRSSAFARLFRGRIPE